MRKQKHPPQFDISNYGYTKKDNLLIKYQDRNGRESSWSSFDIKKDFIENNKDQFNDFLNSEVGSEQFENAVNNIMNYAKENKIAFANINPDNILKDLYHLYGKSTGKDISYSDLTEAINPREKQERIKREKEQEEAKQREIENVNRLKKVVSDYDKKSFNDIEKDLDGDKLYTNKPFSQSEGGYSGASKSNRAVEAEKGNQRPLSKWNKENIQKMWDNGDITFSYLDNDLDEYVLEKIKQLSDKEIKNHLLDEVSWHHTSAFANPTKYYGLKSPKEIMKYISQRKV